MVRRGAHISRMDRPLPLSCRLRLTYARRPEGLLLFFGPLSLLAHRPAKNNFDQSPARRLITPSLVKGPLSPRVNIFLLHHRISTRVLFQCSNGELWWPDTKWGSEYRIEGGERGFNKLGRNDARKDFVS